MADTQPGEPGPAEAVDRTRREPGPAEAIDRTVREERPAPADPTAAAPVRWAGSAAVPAPKPKRSRWDDADDDSDEWAATPAVDPWAGQDTPWDLIPPPLHTPPPTLTAPPVPPPPATLLEPPPTTLLKPPPATLLEPPPTTLLKPPPPTLLEPSPAGRRPLPVSKAGPPSVPPQATSAVPPTRKALRAEAKRQRILSANAGRPQPAAAPPVAAWPAAPPIAARPAAAPPALARPAAAPPALARPTPVRSSTRSWAAGRPAAGPPTGSMSRRDWTRPPPVPGKNLAAGPRRRRRWPANLALFSLLSFACCCGIPAYYAWPAARQYPVSASLPDTVADLSLRDDDASKAAADRLGRQMRDENASVDSVFAGVYGDRNGKRVTVFGITGLRFAPGSDVKKELARLSDTYDLGETSTFDAGESGVHELCAAGKSVVVCAWADHGSLATVILTRRSLDDSADLVSVLRSAVLTRG